MTLGYDGRWGNGYDHGYWDAENRYKAYMQYYVEGLQEELENRQLEFHLVTIADTDTYRKMGLNDVLIGRIASLKFAIKLAEERML
jgi:hypothetical protein